jgi:hypothetical protein
LARSSTGASVRKLGGHGSRAARLARALRREALGYLAAIAFLSAYALMIAGAARILQAALNLMGSGLAASYLWRKRALPNVLLNVAWAVITVAGLIRTSGTA